MLADPPDRPDARSKYALIQHASISAGDVCEVQPCKFCRGGRVRRARARGVRERRGDELVKGTLPGQGLGIAFARPAR